jgi:hypothetical protein
MLAALQVPLFVHPLYVCKVYVIKSLTKKVVFFSPKTNLSTYHQAQYHTLHACTREFMISATPFTQYMFMFY